MSIMSKEFWENPILLTPSSSTGQDEHQKCTQEGYLTKMIQTHGWWRMYIPKNRNTVDGRNPANQLRLVVYRIPLFTTGFIHPNGGWPWDFWTSNSSSCYEEILLDGTSNNFFGYIPLSFHHFPRQSLTWSRFNASKKSTGWHTRFLLLPLLQAPYISENLNAYQNWCFANGNSFDM